MLNQLPIQPESPAIRLAIIGIGNELRSDDGAGVLIARQLSQALKEDSTRPLVIEACSAPENVLGPVIRYQPHGILLIDAAETGASPGTIGWLPGSAASSVGGSTHTISLATLSDYLSNETGATVGIISLQPQKMNFGETLSDEIKLAIQDVVSTIVTYWRSALAAVSANSPEGVSVVKA
jgi:hydrogenase maturation protease HycI